MNTLKFLTFLLPLLFAFTTNAQLSNHRFHLYARYGGGIQDSTTYSGGSLNAEWLIHDNIGLNYNFDYLVRKDDYRHLHTPMGLIGGPLAMAMGFSNLGDGDSTNGRGGLGIFGGLLLFALPDGVSGHFNVGYHWDLSPYANVLGIDFVKNRANDATYIKYACSFGFKTTYMIRDRWAATAFVEMRKTARFPVAFGGGIGFGVLLGNRDESEEFVE